MIGYLLCLAGILFAAFLVFGLLYLVYLVFAFIFDMFWGG